ncbi:TetR/AcrR family transcriptional regulator (plasmid) [Rhodococcus sp. USK10]|uniref:TetR family transcriptional regulator n=1 Tax=Rhodococcus sp. USK10 TaxID=2789739 RepID=UPI001C5FB424|nr:TetR family transcriptional regulator [Rhodococcus sp. USK10]QYB00108.1 TetR/AcrR family transcriptional regulator [Rhodococcus sp. USK10]
MTPSVPDVPRAVQERSKRTHKRIYLAGIEVLEKQGPSALTIANVAAAAGVSTGSVYRRFGSKEQLLTVIQHEFVEEFKTEMASRLNAEHVERDAPLRQAVRVAVRGFAETFEARQRLLRELMLVSTENPGVLDVGSRGAIECGTMFRELLLGVADKITHPQPEEAIDYAYRMLYSVCAFRALFGENVESRRPAPWTALIEETASALCAYLSADG